MGQDVLYVLYGNIFFFFRYVWKHGIVPRQVDIVTSPSGELTCARRNKRISITFRQVRSKPCDCPYLEFCDRSDKDEIDDQVAERLENLHVHQVRLVKYKGHENTDIFCC